jgi:hypothetical protein
MSEGISPMAVSRTSMDTTSLPPSAGSGASSPRQARHAFCIPSRRYWSV